MATTTTDNTTTTATTQGYFAAGPDPFYSKDGSTWVESSSSLSNGDGADVSYGNKMFVIVHRQYSPYIITQQTLERGQQQILQYKVVLLAII